MGLQSKNVIPEYMTVEIFYMSLLDAKEYT